MLARENDDNPVVVFTSSDYMEAQFVASALNGSEVPTIVLDDNICRIFPQVTLLVGGAKVVVRVQHAQRALEVLGGATGNKLPLKGRCLSIPLSVPALFLMVIRNWLKKKRPTKESN